MKLKQLDLVNVGRFQDLHLNFAPTPEFTSKVTVFIAANGGGKTTILRALSYALGWLSARIRSDKSNGPVLNEAEIRNDRAWAALSLCVQEGAEGAEFAWTLAKTRPGQKGQTSTDCTGLSRLADLYRSALSADLNTNLPLIAAYPVERGVSDIAFRVKKRPQFTQLDGYENALQSGVDFRTFFEWFREREDLENEQGQPQALLDLLQREPERVMQVQDFLNDGGRRVKNLAEGDFKNLRPEISKLQDAMRLMQEIKNLARDRQLEAVRTAISHFMPGFDNLRVRRKPRLQMAIDKHGETLDVGQLSQGERSLMALVGDIARRMAMLNPGLENPLLGTGVVLIDEVEMHLHPKWARTLIANLTRTFPNCQFILTTHSPLVISDCKDVLVYALEDGQVRTLASQYGQDVNSVLLEEMDADIRNPEVARRLHDLLDLIQDRKLEAARVLLADLEQELPAHHLDLVKARVLLRKEALRDAKN